MTLGTGYWGEACLQQHHGLAAEHDEGGQHLRRKVRCLVIFFLKNGASTARTLLLLWVLTLHVQQWTAMSVAAACSDVGYLLNELKRTEKSLYWWAFVHERDEGSTSQRRQACGRLASAQHDAAHWHAHLYALGLRHAVYR